MTTGLFLAFIALIAGLARGFSGFGAALIFMPLASALIGPQTAAPVLVIIDLLLAAPLIPGAVRRVALWPIAVMLAGVVVTVPLGTWLLTSVDPLLLRWMIAGLAALMLALLGSGWRYSGAPSPVASFAVGATSGFFSGVAQVGGPPVVAYWLGGRDGSGDVRAKIIVFFAGSSVILLVSYLTAGLFNRSVLVWAAVAGPSYGTGLFLGTRLFGLASEATFRRICLGLIALAVVLSLPVWG